ncbi:hypothetical protein Bhyg_03313 [Pseudolycoriella hygida]|uniref:Uncharacterized protein n=1 Tax=Pseudolycoriella hygida TaxID=35572 RepID=A0A9Q0NDG3_9DIPT|nr:hypothetical protein Bhyg_03313 [Pseudolycoriella hygida]
MVATWKNDGEEDKFIVKLIKQGKVHKLTSPAFLKSTYPVVFGAFSLNVIRNHLNALKRNSGLFLEDLSEDQITELECSQQDEAQQNSDDKKSGDKHNNRSTTSMQNYPFLCNTFNDPETQSEKVIIAMSIPGGATNVRLTVNTAFRVVTIKYLWPATLYTMQDLFKRQINSKRTTIYHPMISSLQSTLENVRQQIDDAPEAIVEVKLPIHVQSSTDSFEFWGVKRDDGTMAIVAIFKGYSKAYSIKVVDSIVKFDH